MSKDINKISFIKDCMADALEKLMETRHLKDISVEEITDLAGVGRATYFRNFNSKYEVVAYKQIKEWKAYRDEHELFPSNEFNYDKTLMFWQFQYKVRERTRLRFSDPDGNMHIFSIVVKEVFAPEDGNEYEDSYKIAFFSYGLMGLLQKWLENGFKETPEEMVNITSKWFK